MSRHYAYKSPAHRWVARELDRCGGWLMSRRTMARPAPRRLLIIRLDHLGDVIQTLPLVQALNGLQPKPFIAIAASSVAAKLLRRVKGFDAIIPFDAPWFVRSGHSSSITAFVRALRSMNFDMSFELKGDLRHHLLLAWAEIPYRVGYANTGGAFLLQEELPFDRQRPPAEGNLAFAAPWHTTGDPIPHLPWTLTEEERIWLQKTVPGQDDLAVFHVDAGTPAKRWDLRRFVELGRLCRKRGYRIAYVGSDLRVSTELTAAIGEEPAVNLVGETSLEQLMALLTCARIVVSTDSGPAHIASALGKPVFIIWSGTSDPSVWAPRGSSIATVQQHVPCEYCEHRVCPLTRQWCLDELTTHQAAGALESFLNRLSLPVSA